MSLSRRRPCQIFRFVKIVGVRSDCNLFASRVERIPRRSIDVDRGPRCPAAHGLRSRPPPAWQPSRRSSNASSCCSRLSHGAIVISMSMTKSRAVSQSKRSGSADKGRCMCARRRPGCPGICHSVDACLSQVCITPEMHPQAGSSIPGLYSGALVLKRKHAMRYASALA